VIVFWSICALGFSQPDEFQHSQVLVLQDVYDTTTFRTGLDLFINRTAEILKNSSVAIIANRGSINHKGEHGFDVLKSVLGNQCRSFIQVLEEDNPESNAGFIYRDSELDGGTKYFTMTAEDYAINAERLNGAGTIIIDLQDSGLRESLALGVTIEAMQFSAEARIPIIILDRPNPLKAVETGGPMSSQAQFSGGYSLPARHGLTIGEMALLINEESWLKKDQHASLTVIKMANYYRNMSWHKTGLNWSFADEAVRDEETAILCAGLYFFRFTSISLGVGTIQPYQFIGAPWISADALADVIGRQNLPGVEVRAVKFTPHRDENSAVRPLYMNVECSGISVRIRDCAKFDTYRFGVVLLDAIAQLYPRHFKWIQSVEADCYFGNADFRTWVNIGANLKPMLANWSAEATAFQKLRLKYYLYPFQKI